MVPFSDERADSQVHKTSSDQAELNAVDYDSEFLRKFHWTFVVNKHIQIFYRSVRLRKIEVFQDKASILLSFLQIENWIDEKLEFPLRSRIEKK